MIYEQKIIKLAKGVKLALICDVNAELSTYPNEDFVCSGRLHDRLYNMGLVDKSDIVDRASLERILMLLASS